MFESSSAFGFFDYFRIPYQVAGDASPPGTLRISDRRAGPRLHWLPATEQATPAWFVLNGTIPIFGAVTADAPRTPGWEPWLPITTPTGERHASVWLRPDGSVLLPFDPDELISNLLSERYRTAGSGGPAATAMGLARRGYHRLRPLLPRSLQIRLRQRFSGVQQRSTFPAWPVESALHDLYCLLFDLLARIAGEQVPYVSLWPQGYTWALVLTHDVETQAGHDNLHLLRDLELSLGLRSSWNFVPRRYDTDERVLDGLRAAGCEVGVHGLYHDGRDFASLRTFRRRLPEIHDRAQRWGASGFRSPALHRVWDWMPELRFEYDSSYPDTDPYQPVPGGCCSLLPYHNAQLVELPITLAQDFVLFDLLQHSDEALWLQKVEHVRRCGGMALVLTHPDYMMDPARRAAYERFLDVRNDLTAWNALPSEVAAWWRRRGASAAQREPSHWRVIGPAAEEAHVAFAGDPDGVAVAPTGERLGRSL